MHREENVIVGGSGLVNVLGALLREIGSHFFFLLNSDKPKQRKMIDIRIL